LLYFLIVALCWWFTFFACPRPNGVQPGGQKKKPAYRQAGFFFLSRKKESQPA